MNPGSAKSTLLLIGAVFFLPIVLAWLMYLGLIDFGSRETSNRGTLIHPPVKLIPPDRYEELGLAQHWVLVYPLPDPCGHSCEEDLVSLGRAHRALGREGERVRIALLTDRRPAGRLGEEIERIHPAFRILVDGSRGLSGQLEDIHGGHGVYLIDPLGNAMMYYHPAADANDIRIDLARLLKYAKTDRPS